MSPFNTRNTNVSLLKKTCLSVFVAALLFGNANAQHSNATQRYEVAAGDLIQAVNQISRSSGIQVIYDIELLRGKQSSGITGSMTLEQALDRALKGTGLNWSRVSASTISIHAKSTETPSTPTSRAEPRKHEPMAASEIKELEEVVVVGSRLGTSPVDSAMPIKVITREQIDRSGAGTIAQALTYLSEIPINNLGDREIGVGTGQPDGGNTNSSTVQMRGLPRGTTLILINGRRAGDSATFSASGQFDLSTIPLALVEQIEVLPAGASAVYGGDGLAGVVNVVLRRDASGLEFRVRRSEANGYGTSAASAVWGKAWVKGSMTLAANWNKNDGLFNQDRELTSSQDYRRYGGADLRSTTSAPGNIFSLDGCPPAPGFCTVPLAERGNLPGLESPFATVPAGSSGVGLTPADFVATQGQLNKATLLQHLKSPEENYGLTWSGRLEFSDRLELFGELTHTKRDVPAFQRWFGTFGGEWGTIESLVSADNPFNPFGVPVGVNYYYRDTGLYTKYKQTHWRGLIGLAGKLRRFDWEITALQARDKSRSFGAADYNAEGMAAALQATDPTRALNPFVGDGSAPGSLEVLASMLATGRDQSTATRTNVVTGFIRGPIMTLQAGDLVGLIGMERQRQSVHIDSNDSSLIVPYVDGNSGSRAAFMELRVPVVSPKSDGSLERIALTGAFRTDSSDRFSDSTRTKTLGVEARPTEKVLLRATYSTAFRPLLAYSAVQAPLEMQQWVSDPLFDYEWYPVDSYLMGGVPEGLKPENSTTVTMGITYRPSSDWTLSLTHWDIRFRDRISFIDNDSLINNEDLFPGRIVRDQLTNRITFIDTRQVNIARNRTTGVDVGVNGYWDTSLGSFNAGLAATYTYEFEQQLTDTAPVERSVGVYNRNGWVPRWKIVPSLGWDSNSWINAMLLGRYVGRYRESTALSTGPNAGTYQVLGDFWVFDLNATISLDRFVGSKSLLGRTKLSFGATNFLNKMPDYCASCSFKGYDSGQYDILGRSIYAELRASF